MAKKTESTAVIKKTSKSATIKRMRILGVYKPEYDTIIEIYVDLTAQYAALNKRFLDEGYPVTVPCGEDGDSVKGNPLVKVLESLRKDILAYSDRLCLNPKAINNVDVTVTKLSKLELALREMASGD